MNSTLYQEIKKYMQLNDWNITILSNKSGIHISEISRILNNKQSISLKNLDAITNAFGLLKGSFYSLFIEECLNDSKHIDKRRCTQFLYRCALEGYEEHTLDLLDLMLEEKLKTHRKKNIVYIFSVAERLFHEGKEEQALPLYEVVIENDSERFSEIVAISYFRRFFIVRRTAQGQRALTYVLDQLSYLPMEIKKEAYMWIMADYYRREEWNQVLNFAEKLQQLAKEGEYYGRALMYRCFALTRVGNSLEEVLEGIQQYSQVNDYFSDLAVGNRYVALLDFGRLEYVDEYLEWLETRNDAYAGLPRILETYVKLNRLKDAERLIERFQDTIHDLAVSKDSWLKEQMYLDFRYAHALFQCRCDQFEAGLMEILEVADLSNKIGNIERFKKCLLVFWEHKLYATVSHEKKYMKLLLSRNVK